MSGRELVENEGCDALTSLLQDNFQWLASEKVRGG